MSWSDVLWLEGLRDVAGARVVLAVAMGLATACSHDPEPCQDFRLRLAPESLAGTLTSAGTSYDLTTCEVTLAWYEVVFDRDPPEARFHARYSDFLIRCMADDGVALGVSAGALFRGPPFEPTDAPRLALDARVGSTAGISFCEVVSDPRTFELTFTTRTGEVWPDVDTPFESGFERVFDVTLAAEPPYTPPRTGGDAEALCGRAETLALSLTATFRIDEAAIQRRENLTCTDADVIAP